MNIDKSTLQKINGAIIGLNLLKDRFNDFIKEHHKLHKSSGDVTLSERGIRELIDYQMRIFEKLKIKELEKRIKEKKDGT